MIGILSFSPLAYSYIPPTPAFKIINTTSGNVTASTYDDFVEFVAGTGITISPNYALNEITFSAPPAGLTSIHQIGNVSSSGCLENEILKVNSTGYFDCAADATGGTSALDDLTDLIITSPAYLSTLFYDGVNWIDKIFSVNSITGTSGNLLYGVSNQTGAWTTATIKNPLLDGSNHTDTVAQTVSRGSLIFGDSVPKWNELTIGTSGKVLTSDGTDISWETPLGGTDRESLVAYWVVDRTWTNIGASFVNVIASGVGDPVRIDTNGKTTVTLMIDWTKVGAGTQMCKIAQVGAENTILIMFSNLASGVNTNATVSIPVAQQDIIANYKPMCRSTTSTDDPVWLTGQVLLR